MEEDGKGGGGGAIEKLQDMVMVGGCFLLLDHHEMWEG